MGHWTLQCPMSEVRHSNCEVSNQRSLYSDAVLNVFVIYCGLVTPYSEPYSAWRQQSITWTTFDFSLVSSCGIHMGAISHPTTKLIFCIICLQIIAIKLLSHLQGANKLISIEAKWCIYASVNKPSLVQIMACRLAGTKPLSEPMLEFYQLDPWE